MNPFKLLRQKLGHPLAKSKENVQQEDYLSLILTPTTVTAAVWNFRHDKVHIKAASQRAYQDSENLVHQTAYVIDTAAETAQADVSKVVFGLSHSHFEGEELSPKTAKILKHLSQELDLDAQAFVSLAAALNHYLKIEESVTPTAIFVGAFNSKDTPFCEVHFVKNNKIVTTKTAVAPPTTQKVIQLITQIKSEHESLPSRIVIFGDGAGALAQGLAGASFTNIFIHEPKITTIEEDNLSQAVAFAQAADILGHDPVAKTAPITTQPQEQEEVIEDQNKDSETAQSQEKPGYSFEAGNSGFIEGKDVLEEEIAPAPSEAQEPHPATSPLPILKREKEEYAVEDFEGQTLANVHAPYFQHQETPVNRKTKKKLPLPKISLPHLPTAKFRTVAIVLVLAAIFSVGAVFAAGKTITKAQVIVKVNPKSLEREFFLTAIKDEPLNSQNSQIPAKLTQAKVQGSQKDVATGKKKTGTKAKGEVKMFNFDTSSAKEFPAGTEVITQDGIKFTLDSSTEVPKRNGSVSGQSTVPATAAEIGTKHNIPAQTAFTIVGFDEILYYAESNTDFTGGDEKEITVASQQDLDKLEKSLKDSLVEKAKSQLFEQTKNIKVYDQALSTQITLKKFDKNVDDEASLINLDMEVTANVLGFEETDIKKVLAQNYGKTLQDNLEAREQDFEILNISVKRNKDELALSGKFKANLVPKLNEEKIKEAVRAKSIKEARGIIKEVPEVADVTFTFSPNLPLFDSLPPDVSKIKIRVESK